MKHQYFGDKTDYIKHGLLRGLCRANIPLGIHWTLTPDDKSSDGSRTTYLKNPDQWRHYDPVLFDVIQKSLHNNDRSLLILQKHALLTGANECFDEWTADKGYRQKSLTSFTKKLPKKSLIFLDPDNGLETKSMKHGSDACSKYVYFDEVEQLWQQGFSLLLYQHFPRVSREKYLNERFTQLEKYTPKANQFALITSHVAFIVLIQPEQMKIKRILTEVSSRWTPHIMLFPKTSTRLKSNIQTPYY